MCGWLFKNARILLKFFLYETDSVDNQFKKSDIQNPIYWNTLHEILIAWYGISIQEEYDTENNLQTNIL